MIRLGLLVALLFSLGCGASNVGLPASLRGLPPRQDPPLDLSDDDDLGRSRALYDALPLDGPERSLRRQELIAAYQQRIERVGDNHSEAFRYFQALISMWDARELANADAAAPDLALAVPTAKAVFQRASSAGLDLEAVTALAVLAAALPAERPNYEKTWNEIVAYTNDLAVAEAGPGAERSRAIQLLEATTATFPSRWSGDQLAGLYLARQAALQKAIAAGTKAEVLSAHKDPGVARPVWNLVRLLARMRRLADAPASVAPLAGQYGDEPELRKRLTAALGDGATGTDIIALMAAYLPSHQAGEGDAGAALAICESGAERLPQAAEPRKCAAEIARITERVPLAIRWVEEARRVAPDDHDVAEIGARLYLARIADQLAAERVDEAKRGMQMLEAFFVDADKRWPGKPIGISLGDAYLTYGRGLYNQGEVAEGVAYLERAQRLDPSPAVTEELATVALKTGRYTAAEDGFVQAAEPPRSTPLETTFERNRLRRLAGEAAALAGDKTKAVTLWKKTIADWTETAGAALSERARAEAAIELGRLYDDLGEREKSAQQMAQAVDADRDQVAVYGDVIAFLATRGQYDAALDAYHRALGRNGMTEYLKVYTSLWLIGLARMQHRQPDASALELLTSVARGGRWYHELARFTLGQLTFQQLLAKADTRGKRAEAYFYEALARTAAGDAATAKELLEEVVATQMLGFFEYEMARYYLRNGLPGQGRQGRP